MIIKLPLIWAYAGALGGIPLLIGIFRSHLPPKSWPFPIASLAAVLGLALNTFGVPPVVGQSIFVASLTLWIGIPVYLATHGTKVPSRIGLILGIIFFGFIDVLAFVGLVRLLGLG